MSADQKDGIDNGEKAAEQGGCEARKSEKDAVQEQYNKQRTALPEIDFSTFILSLSTSVMVHLGQAPSPDGADLKDLDLAKQTIDILGMLKEKTAGNLSVEEDKLLCEMLYDLRLRYVSAAN